MTDLLRQIDEGIARHRVGGTCAVCRGQMRPCKTLKALQGWREAMVEGERLRADNRWAGAELGKMISRLEDAEAKLADLKKRA